MQEIFRKFSIRCADAVGTSWTFLVAIFVIVVWAASGPIFDYSDTWQLLINTGTTIVTFLMVFLIQNAQNREAKCTELKLDELLRALDGARTRLVDLEHLTDEELMEMKDEFSELASKAPKGVQCTFSSPLGQK